MMIRSGHTLLVVLATAALDGLAAATQIHRDNARNDEEQQRSLFAYMDTRNADDTVRRTHVFALTQDGTLAERVTSKINEWRVPVNDSERQHEAAARHRYRGTLEFASDERRQALADHLLHLIIEFNQKATVFFQRQGEKVPQDYLFKIVEAFDLESEQKWLPSQNELNSIHEQCHILRGITDESFDPRGLGVVSQIWGDSAKIFRQESTLCRNLASPDDVSTRLGLTKCYEMTAREQTHHLFSLLELIDTHIHAVQAMGKWQVQNRFNFNSLTLETDGEVIPEPFFHEDIHPERWRYALEMGGLYLAYTRSGKNILNVMHDNDFAAFHRENAVQFQQEFKAELYLVWTLGNETEQLKKDTFYNWWQKHDITGNYGYPWGKWEHPNGFIRFGQQVCDPPTDCDRSWLDLMDEFAETPIVDDVRFSDRQPYGETRSDLRFLYPGDHVVLEEARLRKYPKKLRQRR